MRDYSVYHITPPSLFVIADGPEVYISGFSDSDKEKIFETFESLIYDYEIGFYYNDEPVTEENIGWLEYVIPKANFIVINASNITPLEQYIIENSNYENEIRMVIYYSDDGLTPYCRILAKNGENVLFDLNDLEDFIKYMLESNFEIEEGTNDEE